jgi:hypothetical protein
MDLVPCSNNCFVYSRIDNETPIFCGTIFHKHAQYRQEEVLCMAMLRIHDILRQIRVISFGPYTGFWIRLQLFSSVTFKMPTKNKIIYFGLFLTVGTFTPVFKDNKSLRSHNVVIIPLNTSQPYKILRADRCRTPPPPPHITILTPS